MFRVDVVAGRFLAAPRTPPDGDEAVATFIAMHSTLCGERCTFNFLMYRAPGKSMYFLLSRTQAGPGRTVTQQQEEISRNHVQTFICLSVE